MIERDYLTPPELAERWKVSEVTLRSWRKRDKGPAYYRVGPPPHGAIRYAKADVLAYERDNRTTTREVADDE